MKILQVIQSRQLRGAEIFACQLSEQLILQGCHVDVVYLFDSIGPQPEFNVRFIQLNANRSLRLVDINAYLRLGRIIKEGDYDIVQANAGDTLKYIILSRLVSHWSAKVVFRNANLMSGFIHGKVHKHFNRWLLNGCHYFISVSENCRLDLVSIVKHAVNRSQTIPIGTFRFDDVAPMSREAIKGPVFINVASFVPEKNHELLIKSFNTYFRRNGKGHLWLVGGGKLLEAMKALVKQLDIEDRVVFWGYRSDVISILKAADVFVMTSYIEGLPGVILEALSCGIPVITPAVGGIPEVIKDGVNGFCLKGHSSETYIERMEVLDRDADKRNNFISAGRNLVYGEYGIVEISKKFKACYETVISR